MRKIKWLICFLLILSLVSAMACIAIAEGEESSEESTESSEDENSRKVSVTGDTTGANVLFDGESSYSKSHTASVGDTVKFTVTMSANYELKSVKLNGVLTLSPDEYGVYSFAVDADAENYVIKISANYNKPEESSEDETSDESSGDETSDESSGDETSDESSGDETSDESSGGETSDESSGGETSDESSGDETSDESSGDETSQDSTFPLVITINGPGSVSFGSQAVSSSGSTVSGIINLVSGTATPISVTPAYGYQLTSLYLDGVAHTLSENLTLTITEKTTLSVTFSAEATKPTSYIVKASCYTAGGTITVDGLTAVSGTPITVSKEAGSDVTITVTADSGYEIESFRVAGQTQNLTNGTYVITGIGVDTTVAATFKTVSTSTGAIEADEFSWAVGEDGNITLEIGSNTYLGKSIFDKINTITSSTANYVVLDTTYIRWYIPCGSTVGDVSDDPFHMVTMLNDSGSYYQTIRASIDAQDQSAGTVTKFNYYEMSKMPTFPTGTLASFNLAELADGYTGNGTDLMVKSDNSLVVCGTGTVKSDGWTTPMEYKNSKYMVVRVSSADYYTIQADAMSNGKITPSGTNSVAFKSDAVFTVSANTGYIISAVYVDDVPVAGAAGTTEFGYTFSSVTGNHNIKATFILSGSDYTVVNNVAVLNETSDSGDDSGKGISPAVIVGIVIALIAVIGAAALFIVKIRQNKF